MIVQIVRPATVCGLSPRMRLDVSVNMLTMQALTRGEITVFGGDQTRPNIHMTDYRPISLSSGATRFGWDLQRWVLRTNSTDSGNGM